MRGSDPFPRQGVGKRRRRKDGPQGCPTSPRRMRERPQEEALPGARVALGPNNALPVPGGRATSKL